MGHFKLLAARKSRFIAIWAFLLKFSGKEDDVYLFFDKVPNVHIDTHSNELSAKFYPISIN